MGITVAVVGEEWEAGFARVTARSFATWLPEGAEVCIPSELERAVADLCPRPPRICAPAREGFQGYAEIRERLLREAGGDGLLLLAAGTLPASQGVARRPGAPLSRERAVEWHAPEGVGTPRLPDFRPPPHSPPARPRHASERVGTLDVWTVEGGREYFQALPALSDAGGAPVWSQYGARRPVFVYNTNDFDEPPPEPHDQYFILGSGLLGLRMIAESRPKPGARVLVYDINPDQLLWIKFVLEVCGEAAEFSEVVERFRARHGRVEVRAVLPHEAENAARQAEWYGRNRRLLSETASRLSWEFLECDLWNDPAALLGRVRSARSLFFMYLDLFVVWRLGGGAPWVEIHAEAAASLEAAVRGRAGGSVTFLPGPGSARFQLHPESPFAERKG